MSHVVSVVDVVSSSSGRCARQMFGIVKEAEAFVVVVGSGVGARRDL